jgi:protein-S-isoprenylcysteine O-methyltransferase Ste14
MRRGSAAIGTLVFFLVAPGVVVGLVPRWLTGWSLRFDWPLVVGIAGLVLLVAGVAVLVQAFARFVVEGFGTPSPIAPTERLVVGGWYRYVRNPMYVAVVTAIVGQGLWFAQPVLLGYAALVWVVVAAFVRWYEEPHLLRQFGEAYRVYLGAVPGWIPRLRPWESGRGKGRSGGEGGSVASG